MNAPHDFGPPQQLDPQNPWPGLASYDESSWEFFSGRGAESDELLRRIVDEQVTVLFGKSGLGKSSILKAGIFPRLRDKGYLPILVRLQIHPGAAPLIEQLSLALFEALRVQAVDHVPLHAGQSLWSYLHTPELEFWTKLNYMTSPVFVLDQFEEVFTLGRAMPAEVAAFRIALADLAENRIPAALQQHRNESGVDDDEIDTEAMPYKIVLSLREDFLADLEDWCPIMPSLRRNRMRLLPMGRKQALLAVYNDHTKHLVTEELAGKIVDFLSRSVAKDADDNVNASALLTVEPALLSLFCREVNEHRKQLGAQQVTYDLFEGGKDTIITGFYCRSLAPFPSRVRHFVEEELITEHGYRNSYSIDDAIGNRFVTKEELATLVDGRLLRLDHQHGTERVELTHDLLTKAALEERDQRRVEEQVVAERKKRDKLVRHVIVGGIVLLCLTLTVYWIWSSNETQRKLAQSRALATFAGAARDQDPVLGVLLSLESLKRADTSEARSALLAAGQYVWPSVALDPNEVGGPATVLALNKKGDLLAVITDKSALSVFDLSKPIRKPLWSPKPAINDAMFVAFSPDQTLLAVARPGSVDLLYARTGELFRSLQQTGTPDRAFLVFSPDGKWLASLQKKEEIRLWDYLEPSAAEATVPASGVLAMSITRNGETIIGAGQREHLFMERIEQKQDGSWVPTEIDLTRCLYPQSVSPGAETFSGNFKATTCVYTAARRSEDADYVASEDRRIDDVVWSPGGGAFAEFLNSGDIIVGEGKPKDPYRESRIKGAKLRDNNNRAGIFSITEDAGRAALIDQSGVVHIYSVSPNKPLLGMLGQRDAVDIAPDGRWIAIATPANAWIDKIPVPASDGKQEKPMQFQLRSAPETLYATRNGIVAVLAEGRQVTTLLLEPTTGKNRVEPQMGRGRPLGREGELLLIEDRPDGRIEVIRTRDGAIVTPPGETIASGPYRVDLSPSGTALGFWRRSAANPRLSELTVYAVRDEQLMPAGRPIDLPFAPDLAIYDDAQSIAVCSRAGHSDAHIFSLLASEPTSVAIPAKDCESRLAKAGNRISPAGGFEVKGTPSTSADQDTDFEVVQRPGGKSIKRLGNNEWRFSTDDRWLAYWNSKNIRVLDLTSGDMALSLDFTRVQGVQGVEFKGNNAILEVKFEHGIMLVPFDRDLMERVAHSLTMRTLTGSERCTYGISEADCRQAIAISRASDPASQPTVNRNVARAP
ncbi:WD40 repeat domain-containing protein [Paraburkholderia hospita]|uniref:WD40 repeat domain-containing protein n=1 Tax=Paraburkholderia hospita TaxID=169430 RepID=A0AAN1JI19_9BURK|nr:WD40 repeat domain-containing protein [Paraburkholderia hospita]AUT74391.1 WD40 repeat domain-containing protein [Paraburkholderia hospita]EIM99297.1 hypothetical protein WQE_19364 [Paraburkholderia hospita]OUL78274.1 hypothetical protein CA601_36530 [Paraburkholderia hospita]OUL78430.1 hypothetical protein CA602_31795 [Paraburkholderia hospita]SEH64161.1 hypothetical protein SAMN05192544_100587 [Paraburkholderia hospita]